MRATRPTRISDAAVTATNVILPPPSLPVPPTASPISIKALTEYLHGYPQAAYIIDGFTYGFSIAFEGTDSPLSSNNAISVLTNHNIVAQKLSKELSLNRISGPYKTPPFPNFKCSPLALRPKQQPGKYRLLHNLSYPYDENSVNRNIPQEAATVKYQSLQDAINLIHQHLPAPYLAKSDIADAFRLIPVHPSQHHLLGFSFAGQYYFDKMLPMGAATSCSIFETISDAIQWILANKFCLTSTVKVLDDFLFVQPTKQRTLRDLNTFTKLCAQLNIPLAPHKTEGPATTLTFLGIELDTVAMQARLPSDKLTSYIETLHSSISNPILTLRDLRSMIGQLQFATKVIPSGRPFLRRLYNLTIGRKHPFHKIHIPPSTVQDLYTWSMFLQDFNGITLMAPRLPHLSSLCSDASKSGYGAVFGSKWFQGLWPPSWTELNIAVLELYPIFMMISIFAQQLSNTALTFYTDNMAVVAIVNKQTSKCNIIMQIIRPLVLILLRHNITLKCKHVPGTANTLCDALSRQVATPALLQKFRMSLDPVPIPTQLLPENFNLSFEQH